MKGFTLVEVLIVIAIFVLVSVAVFNVYLTGQKFYQRGGVRAELLQNGRVILERMTRELRQTREITTTLSEDESGATSTVSFEDGHSTTTYHYIHYFQDGDLIKREVLGYYFSGDDTQTLVPWDATPPQDQTLEVKTLEAPVIIGEYVENLEIWGLKLVNISLILEEKNENVKLQTKIFGRNL